MKLKSKIKQGVLSFYCWLQVLVGRRYRVVIVEGDLSHNPKKKTLYIVCEDSVPWHLSMLCPCGCQSTLHMNLLPDERPFWTLSFDDKHNITLHPSVWRQVGCCSHFWIRRSKIYWC